MRKGSFAGKGFIDGLAKVCFLGEVPLEPGVREGGDSGDPVMVSHPGSQSAKAFTKITKAVLGRIAEVGAAAETGGLEIIQ